MNHQKDNHITEVQRRELDLSISNGNYTLFSAMLNISSGMAASHYHDDEIGIVFLVASLLALGGLTCRSIDVGVKQVMNDVNNAIHRLIGNN